MNLYLDILIDGFTDCLIERSTGLLVDTEYREHINSINQQECIGWKFDWILTQEAGYKVYELFVENESTVQGRISLKIDGGVGIIDIAETAPHNFGSSGKYKGVGGHLFAIACKISLEAGCDGVVAFDSKSDLVEYYKKELNAKEIYPRRLVIFENAAKLLMDKYIKE